MSSVTAAPQPLGVRHPVVEMRGIRRVFGTEPEVVALQSVDFTVRAGEFVAVVGRSGSGKSTLLNTLGLMDTPTAGTYHLDGHDTGALSATDRAGLRGTRLGFVFQAFHLVPSRSVTENVAMAGMYAGIGRSQRRAAALDVLRRVGLGHRLDASPSVLSGGERQRVAIARALASRPALLLADEPTGNLDSTTSDGILALFSELHAGGVSIVMITHDDAVAERAQRRIQMTDGVLHG